VNFLAFSGGKDSTAMALRLAALGERFTMLFTPTGDELPDVRTHIETIQRMTGADLVEPPNHSLAFWMDHFNALPNWRQRWCTRLIKIVPCIAHLKAHPGSTLLVGLRADEELREGLYDDCVTTRFPMRECGWGLSDVLGYIKQRGVTVPSRTDCALCYGQRLGEWYALWRDHPERFAEGERREAETGHTFRSPKRDTWPAPLKELRKRFEAGERPRGLRVLNNEKPCRVCSM
jgi:3'-phosphoadenosine 5'-phosphosulfate sulfotransferase (PAPS reductase)/FAD synthetase